MKFIEKYTAVLITLIAFLVYANTLQNGYVLDDEIITQNQFLQKNIQWGKLFTESYFEGYSPETVESYRPLTLLTFAVEFAVFGQQAWVSHLVNVLLFALAVFLLARQIPAGKNYWLWYAALLLFVVHPIHVEVVANVKSRDELLVFLFGVLGFQFVLKYLKNAHLTQLLGVFSMVLLAALAKENAVVLIGVYGLIALFSGGPKSRTTYTLIGTALLATVIPLVFRYQALNGALTVNNPIALINNTLEGTSSTSEYLGTLFAIYAQYARLLLWPFQLSWDYSYPQIPIQSIGSVASMLGFLVVSAWLALGVFGSTRKKIWGIGFLLFGITFSVYSHLFLPLAATVAERFLFLPSLGFCIALVFGLHELFHKNVKELKYLALSVFSILAVKTYFQNKVWLSTYTVVDASVETAPNSAKVHNAHGSVLRLESLSLPPQQAGIREQLLNQSIDAHRLATELYPNYAEAYFNKGVSESILGKLNEAKESYKQALALSPNNVEGINNLATIYIQQKNYVVAQELLKESIVKFPDDLGLKVNLSTVYLEQGSMKQAFYLCDLILQMDPKNTSALYNLGVIHFNNGGLEKAKEYFVQIPKGDRNYGNALYSLAMLELRANNQAKAIELLEQSFAASQNQMAALQLLNYYMQTDNKERAGYFSQFLKR